jgi:hypothetical protein
MSETADQSGAEAATESPDRRSLLKKAGVVGVGIWAAPVVTSLTSPAYAEGSPPAGRCIVLSESHTVTATISLIAACNSLSFGLASPSTQAVCAPCSPGSSANLGAFPAGTELVFYMEDAGDCCGCPERVTCHDGNKSRVIQDSPTSYRVQFRDNGCYCGPGCQGFCPLGPGSSNISEGVNLEATITLS